MRAREAKKLLRCSYTTLHNYLKQGKIKALNVGNKVVQYDDESVQKMATTLFGETEPKFKVTIKKFNNISTYELDERIVNRIIDYIAFELKNDAIEGMEQGNTTC